MKTQYKCIHFDKDAPGWICRNNESNDILGYVRYDEEWNEQVWNQASDWVFSAGCLGDISHFLKELNRGDDGKLAKSN